VSEIIAANSSGFAAVLIFIIASLPLASRFEKAKYKLYSVVSAGKEIDDFSTYV